MKPRARQSILTGSSFPRKADKSQCMAQTVPTDFHGSAHVDIYLLLVNSYETLITYVRVPLSGATITHEAHPNSTQFVSKVKEPKLSKITLQ